MTITNTDLQGTEETRSRCIECLQELKAEEIQVIDLTEVADFTDTFIICTGGSDTHVRAIADSVLEGMKTHGQRPWHTEGYDSRKWVLLDFVDVVVHIFLRDVRDFYSLERLWSDAPIETIEDAPIEELPQNGTSLVDVDTAESEA